jgi:hypothetical protein
MLGRAPGGLAAGLIVGLLMPACDRGPEAPGLDLPPRPGDAPGGSEIVRDIQDLDVEAREERLYAEVARGNVPTWLRELRRVEVTGQVEGRERRVTVWVAPDYLAVGADDDFFFSPLSPATARRVADRVGGSLPTARIVDAVWLSARRLVPIRLQPDEDMGTVLTFERHNNLVLAQRRRVRPGSFVAGHKLDVVLAGAAGAEVGWEPNGEAGREQDGEMGAEADGESVGVALYGWHLPDGTPIQPFYPIPMGTRPHFSMGVRLVHREVLVDGARRDMREVLRDAGLARLLGAAGW